MKIKENEVTNCLEMKRNMVYTLKEYLSENGLTQAGLIRSGLVSINKNDLSAILKFKFKNQSLAKIIFLLNQLDIAIYTDFKEFPSELPLMVEAA
jgi:predicted XRE-type DNA-binding protein